MNNEWKPATKEEILEEITLMESSIDAAETMFWNLIKVEPSKWQLSPWGDEGDGFWVVAIAGNSAIYYNDIEEGYNVSEFKEYGNLIQYVCDQISLQDIVKSYVYELKNS